MITKQLTTPQTCSYTTLWFVVDDDACIKFSLFSDTDVSQGSSATPLRCGGIVNDDFVAYLLVNLSVKNIWKSVNIWRSYGQYCSALFFLTHSVVWFCSYSCTYCLTVHLFLALNSLYCADVPLRNYSKQGVYKFISAWNLSFHLSSCWQDFF